MSDSTDAPEYLRPADVARRWGVTQSTVRRMIRTGALPALATPTGRYRIRPEDAALCPAAGSR